MLAGCGQKKETTTTTARPVKTTIVESRSIIRKDFSGIVEAVEYVKTWNPCTNTLLLIKECNLQMNFLE